MNDFEASDALVLAVLTALAVGVSYPTGRQKAAEGVPLRSALAAGFGRSFLLVVAVTTVVGAGIARVELAELAGVEEDVVENDSVGLLPSSGNLWKLEGSGLFARLRETDTEWQPVCRCQGCRYAGLAYDSDEIRISDLRTAQAAGYGFPMLAPAFGLLMFIPSMMATAVGYNIGSRRRVEAEMGEIVACDP
jgi:hypothetical protein